MTDNVCDNTAIKLSFFFFLRELPRDNVKIILEIPAMSKCKHSLPVIVKQNEIGNTEFANITAHPPNSLEKYFKQYTCHKSFPNF